MRAPIKMVLMNFSVHFITMDFKNWWSTPSYIKRLTLNWRSLSILEKKCIELGFHSLSARWCRHPPSFYFRTLPVAPRWAANSIYKQDKELMKNEAIINFEVILFINKQLWHLYCQLYSKSPDWFSVLKYVDRMVLAGRMFDKKKCMKSCGCPDLSS